MNTRGKQMQTVLLAVLRNRGGPMSAYEMLGYLREENPRLAPPTVYRALAALTDRGSVHRLESLNAFVACQRDRHDHASILSVCDDCGGVEENIISTELLKELSSIAGKSGFAPVRHVIEIHGQCASCEST